MIYQDVGSANVHIKGFQVFLSARLADASRELLMKFKVLLLFQSLEHT